MQHVRKMYFFSPAMILVFLSFSGAFAFTPSSLHFATRARTPTVRRSAALSMNLNPKQAFVEPGVQSRRALLRNAAAL
eukprot:160629-Rhodomonas_salina.1